MLNRDKLTVLNLAASDEDWIAAAEACQELSLESKGTKDEFFVEELELAVSNHDAELLAIILDTVSVPD